VGVVLAVLARDRLGAAESPSAAASIWSSRGACVQAVASGERLARDADRLRLGTWNIRWFPDGGPGTRAPGSKPGPTATDVDWLACALAWLQADVMVLQEIKGTDQARAALARLTSELDRLTGGRHRVELDRCSAKGRQHVALLFDETRVRVEHVRNVGALNPHGVACAQNLRPGLGAYVRSTGGADFHLIGVHFDSGPKRRDYDQRQRSFDGLGAAFDEAQRLVPDDDVIVAGDFNTMGCAKCSPKIDASAEIALVDRKLAAFARPFERARPEPGCTEYYRGAPNLLDHFVGSRGMAELGSGSRAKVVGYCGVAGCARLDDKHMPRGYAALSDHCPVVLDLMDRDMD
jgi:endonuclease/exonuclease/phosphatase family metal-dependent hydrolase